MKNTTSGLIAFTTTVGLFVGSALLMGQQTQSFSSYITGLAPASTVGSTDKMYVLQGGASKALSGALFNPLPLANGGTNCTTASGTCLDNITNFSTTGAIARTGAGTYTIGTLPVANGGTGDTGTAWGSYSPSPVCGTATFTVNSAKFKTIGKTVFVEGQFTITAIGTCTNQITFTPPVTGNSLSVLAATENTGGKGGYCLVNGSTAFCLKSDVSAFLVNNVFIFGGVYESQ